MKFREFLLLTVGGVFASALVIVIVFIIVNMCIRRKVASYVTASAGHTKSNFEMSYKQNGQEDVRPPLPPRSQFDSESMTNSYEEMPENPTVAEETPSLQNPDSSIPLDTRISFLDNNSTTESYDDVDKLEIVQHDYEDTVSLPDYLEVDNSQTQKSDDGSESYDDVDQLHTDGEDYDDVE